MWVRRESSGRAVFYRARYFDAITGRFLSEDPIGFAGQDQNLYRYVFNNPTNLFDPLGLLGFSVFGQNVQIEGSVTFGPVNVSFDFEGFSSENFSVNFLIPPTSAGAGIDIKINPPGPCDQFVSPFVGAGRNLSVGTNLVLENGSVRAQGLNISVGPSVGIPAGVQVPGPPPAP